MRSEATRPQLPRPGKESDPESLEAAPLAKGTIGPAYGGGEVTLRHCNNEGKEESDDLLPPSADRHYPHLDITRICCVCFVAIDHGDSTFGNWNSLFGQDWVLQYLFLVCGVCFGMSRRSLFEYEKRLFIYFLIGLSVNWTAWLLMGLDWMENFFNVVFHLWFVVGLMIYAAILAPLRPFLAKVREECASRGAPGPESTGHPSSEAMGRAQRAEQTSTLLHSLTVVGGGVLVLLVLFQIVVEPALVRLAPIVLSFSRQVGAGAAFWGFPTNTDESYNFLKRLCSYLQLTGTNIYLILICPRIFTRCTVIGWLLLVNTYGHRSFFYRAADERPFHGLDLMTIALACYYLGLQYRQKIGEYVVRYWFLVLFACAVLWPAGAHGRFDENPPLDLNTRFRVSLMEAVFVIVWLVAGERLLQREIFTEDRLEFLNDWALIVFLVHKAVHIMLPSPLNWVVLISIAPACYMCRHLE